jgi:integrase
VKKADMIEGRDRRKDTPSQSRNFLDAMRGLFRWAVDPEHIGDDPTEGVKNLARPKNDGFAMWTEAEVERYEKQWPIGTKERVWLDVLLYTGLRRGDAVRIGWSRVTDGVATIATEKSGYQVEVHIKLLPTLLETLKAGPVGEETFICDGRGKTLTKETFGNDFREACRLAKVEKSAHGLRKMGATRAANDGATVSQLEAIFGWNGGAMASHYTRKADRRRLAREAITKLNKPKK